MMPEAKHDEALGDLMARVHAAYNLIAPRRASKDRGMLVDLLTRVHAGLLAWEQERKKPIPMRLRCPTCNALHIDEGEFATKPHHTHTCQSCGETWRPAIVATVGVQWLPGFKNGAPT